MGFTTPCFILKNTLQLREKLEGLGYRIGNKYCIDNNFLATDNNEMFGIEEPYLPEECNGYIHCGFNEELFLAIAALRDDTNYKQWFVCTSDYKEFDGKEWKVGDFDLNTCPDDFDNILPHWRKATVNELIEHFKDKKEQLCVE